MPVCPQIAFPVQGQEAWCYYLAEDTWILGEVTHDTDIVMKWFFDQFLKENIDEDEAFDIINEYASEVSPGAEGLLFFPFLGEEGKVECNTAHHRIYKDVYRSYRETYCCLFPKSSP